jgi:hypothetical protein
MKELELETIYPVTGPEAWTFGQPSVAQWARCEALKIVAARYGPGQFPSGGVGQLEALALRWARLIETGNADVATEGDDGESNG